MTELEEWWDFMGEDGFESTAIPKGKIAFLVIVDDKQSLKNKPTLTEGEIKGAISESAFFSGSFFRGCTLYTAAIPQGGD